MKAFGITTQLSQAFRRGTKLMLSGLAALMLTGGHVPGGERSGEAGARTKPTESPEAAVSCAKCKNVWDWGPAYWRWGYSPGVWEVPSKNWPSTPYYAPKLKHLCAERQAQHGKRGKDEN